MNLNFETVVNSTSTNKQYLSYPDIPVNVRNKFTVDCKPSESYYIKNHVGRFYDAIQYIVNTYGDNYILSLDSVVLSIPINYTKENPNKPGKIFGHIFTVKLIDSDKNIIGEFEVDSYNIFLARKMLFSNIDNGNVF